MPITQISGNELQELVPIKNWVGWRVGWITGWYNPFDRLGELVNPAELGSLVKIQGEFLQEQSRILGEEAKMVQGLGEKLNQLGRSNKTTG